MESHWETRADAPLYLVAVAGRRRTSGTRSQALPVPKLLSLLAHYDPDAEVKGLQDVPPADRPPVLPVFLSFRAMVGLAFLFIALSAWAVLEAQRPGEPARCC